SHNQLRPEQHCSGDDHTLLLATAEHMWELGDEIIDGDELNLIQNLADAFFPLRLADAVNDEWLSQDAAHVHERWQGSVGVLLHEANLVAVPTQRLRVR